MKTIIVLEPEDTNDGIFDLGSQSISMRRHIAEADVVVAEMTDMKIRVIKKREGISENIVNINKLPEISFGESFSYIGYPDSKYLLKQ